MENRKQHNMGFLSQMMYGIGEFFDGRHRNPVRAALEQEKCAHPQAQLPASALKYLERKSSHKLHRPAISSSQGGIIL